MTTPTDTTIEGAWNGFCKMVLGSSGISEVQKSEMRKAFYAGFASMYSLAMHAATLEDNEAEKLIANAADELEAYQRELLNSLPGEVLVALHKRLSAKLAERN